MPPHGRPLRVLQVLPSLAAGGAERLVVSAALGLPRERFDVGVLCLAEAGPLADEVRAANVPLEVLDGFPGVRHPERVLAIAAAMRRFRPDVVHTHLQSPNLYARAVAQALRVPVVVASEHNVYASKSRRHILVERLLAERSSALVAVSETVARTLAVQLQLPVERITLIPNGVAQPVPDPARVARWRADLRLASAGVVVGTVASLTPKKGQRVLLDAFASLLRQVPSAVLLLAGEGPERAALEAQSRALGIAEQVRFLGYQADVASVLALLDVFVLPSLVEGMPLALLEAMLAERAVLATAVGGVPEIIRPEVNGLLVPPGDAQALASALQRLADDPGLRARLAAQARTDAHARHSLEHYLASLAELYAGLAARAGVPR